MRNFSILTLFGMITVLAIALAQAGQTKRPVKPLTYKDVAPIFNRRCIVCHRGAKAAHGLDLTRYASIMKGDKKGKVVAAKNPSASRLVNVLHGKPQLMPPGGPLPKAAIATITAWIKAGARP